MGCKSERLQKRKLMLLILLQGVNFCKIIDSEDVDDNDDGASKFVVSEAIKSASVKCNELYGDIPVF